MVDEVDDAVVFDVSELGFEVQHQVGRAIALLDHCDLDLLAAGLKTA